MDAQAMLAVLDAEGGEAGADFNDGEDVLGWFGWSVSDGMLTITHRASDGTETTARWELTPR